MNVDKVRLFAPPPAVQTYTARDTMLYALGLGYGSDPLDLQHLQFVYEDGLKSVPSMCVILANLGFWVRESQYGIDWVRVLHAEQSFEIRRALPTSGTVRGEFAIIGVEDKGKDKGALLHQRKTLFDQQTGEELATLRATLFLRGDGGQGGFGELVAPIPALEERTPDRTATIVTLPQQALLYRLSGDLNPLHADPAIAAKAGFDRPILHGLCTKGLACRAVIDAYCDADPAMLSGMTVRFSRPVMPGETIRFEFFENKEDVRFRARSIERNTVVIDRAVALIKRY